MHLAALPRRSLEVAKDGGLQALVVVGGYQLHAREAPGFKRAEQLVVGRLALGVGYLHPKDLPKAVLPHARDDEDPLAHHPAPMRAFS